MNRITKLIQKIFGYCPNCYKWFKYPKNQRMSSSYERDLDNYTYACPKCYIEIEEYWENCWKSHRSGLL